MLTYESKIFKDFAAFKAVMETIPRPIVFTNGCFDILHLGHVDYLAQAARLGSSLVVGVNSDDSVRLQNKGEDRPYNCHEDRLAVLASLEVVDAVIGFDQKTPLQLITSLLPDVLIKGSDWAIEDIVGADVVNNSGGRVKTIPFRYQRSTTSLANRIKNADLGRHENA